MRRAPGAGRGRRRGDRGSAVVEFVTVGLLLLVPTLYLVLAVGRVQAGVLATEAASRAAARAITSADTEGDGFAAARSLVGYALSDQGFDVDPDDATDVTCPPGGCLTPGGRVTVTVEVTVPLPGLPAVLPGDAAAGIPVSATHVGTVDEFRATQPP
ncbi:MAG: pilus assembly protein [Kineosporiaceae bacterium]